MTSCVSNIDLDDMKDGEYKVSVDNANDYVEVSCSIAKESLLNNIKVRGFYITRIINGQSKEDRIVIGPNENMDYKITDDLWPGLEMKACAFFNENGADQKTQDITIIFNGKGKTPSIRSVRYDYDDASRMTGKITISGTNFGNYQDAISLHANGTFSNENTFTPISCCDTAVVFRYGCYNMGQIPITFTEGTYTNSISSLDINHITLDFHETKVAIGIPHKIDVMLGKTPADSIGCTIDGENMTVSNNFFNDNSTAILPVGDIGSTKAKVYLIKDGHKIYFPDTNIQLVSGWKKVDDDNDLDYRLKKATGFTDTNILRVERDIEEVEVMVTNINTHVSNKYTISSGSNSALYNTGSKYSAITIVDGNNVYFSMAKAGSSNGEYESIVRFDTTTGEFTTVDNVPGSYGELFAKRGNLYYFNNTTKNSFYVYDASAKKLSSTQTYTDNSHFKTYLGSDGDNFYFREGKNLLRCAYNNIPQYTTLDIDLSARAGGLGGNGSSECLIKDNMLYMSGSMRSCSLKDLTNFTYYGYPDNEQSFSQLVYLNGKIYCYGGKGNVFEYVGF